jgi:tetratricopeptide (TPR) repeat protein
MREADGIFVLDTGSTDGTGQRLRNLGAVVKSEIISPWRFDAARNLALEMLPEYADVCVCSDLDERFTPGWRDLLQKYWQEGTNRVFYTYNWRTKVDGTPEVQMLYSRIHSRHGYEWRGWINEELIYIGEKRERTITLPDLVINHLADQAEAPSEKLSFLEQAVKEEPEDAQLSYKLGFEYLQLNMWTQCIEELKRQLGLADSTAPEERSACMRWIAKSYSMLGNYRTAYSWYYRAFAECPDMRDAYVECASMAYELGDWAAVFFCSDRALRITEKSGVFTNMSYAWDHTPDDYAALACWHLGMRDLALKHARQALAISPGEARLQENVRVIESSGM